MIIDSPDEWGHFLHARKLILDRLIAEGQTYESVARVLSMDSMQVQLIHLTEVDRARAAAPEDGATP